MKNRFYNSNNRAVIDEDGNVAQVTNYYPFGGVFSTTAYNHGDDLQPYKYNGKELDRTHGLDWYDYGARNYDAFLPMFTSLDPHCESYYNISPYAYCGNNPVNAIDPNGMDMFHTEDPATIRDILQTLGYTGELKTSDCEVHIDDEYFVSHYYKNGNKYSVGYNVFSYSENNPTEIDGNCKIISFYAAPLSQDSQFCQGYESIGKSGKEFRSDISNITNTCGILTGTIEHGKANPYFWVDAKGNFRSTNLLKKGVHGAHCYRCSYNWAKQYASVYGKAGGYIGWAGVGLTVLQCAEGDINLMEASADIMMGTVGIIGGPLGFAACTLYFVGKVAYQQAYGRGIFEEK